MQAVCCFKRKVMMQLEELKPNEIHIYIADLESAPPLERLDHLFSYLDAEERERIDRYKVDFKKKEFLLGRALVKRLLAAYLDIDPRAVSFELDKYGKPTLASHLQLTPGRELSFNLSHAKRYLAFAFSYSYQVGVDVEHINRNMDIEGLADRYFTKRETAHILSSADSFSEFFHIWTLKEAYIKAVGHGLSIPLNSFEIPYDNLQSGMNGWFFYNSLVESDYFVSAALEKRGEEDCLVNLFTLDSAELD